jgi:hypothetical protein
MEGDRLEGGGRDDVEDRTTPALGHPRRIPAAQVDDGLAVEPQRLDFAFTFQLDEPSHGAEAGTVAQHLNEEVAGGEGLVQAVAGGGVLQVAGERLDTYAVLFLEFLRKVLEPFLAPGHERDAAFAPRERASQIHADPRGGTGDQAGGAH